MQMNSEERGKRQRYSPHEQDCTLEGQYWTHLFVILVLLVVVVRFECQLGTTKGTLEASMVVEGKVLQWANLLCRVDQVAAPITGVLIGCRRKATR